MSDIQEKALPDRINSLTSPGCYSQGPKKNFFIWSALNLITLTHAFESTCLCVTLPTVARELDASLSDSLSFGSCFLLAMALIQPFASELSSIAGRRPALLLGILTFMVGAVICGCANTPTMLLLGRTIQGAGAGATEPIKALIFYDIYKQRERAKWVAFINVSWAIGTVSGPLLGGVFTNSNTMTWRWVFWINLPFLTFSFVAAACLLGYDTPPRLPWKQIATVDWGGLFLFMASGASFLIPLTWAGSRFPWASYQVILPLILGVLGLVSLGFYERRVASRPIFKPSVFREVSTSISCVNIALHGLLMWMLLYYMSIYYLGVKDYDAFTTGLWGLPATLTVAPMSIVVGIVVGKTGHYKSFLWAGWLLTILTFGLLHLLKANSSYVFLVLTTLVVGIGFGSLVPGMAVGIQGNVDREDAGHAICMTFLMRPAGQCLGIAVGLAVFSSRLEKLLVAQRFPAVLAQGLMKHARTGMGRETTEIHPFLLKEIPRIVDCVMEALQGVWTTGAAIAGFAMLLTLCIKTPRIKKDDQTKGPHPGGGVESAAAETPQGQAGGPAAQTDRVAVVT
ncbi:unnamed protein product [Clonostachys solani]|uniref:Major facilitator superfamily (MFS) profile domain-containing protein n=1 Tax=Clonostachys solani TaxID=160281 RepID=A0A9N9ZCJ4_9HYPO|nr:unnamed protein product [Clonostachys solani]